MNNKYIPDYLESIEKKLDKMIKIMEAIKNGNDKAGTKTTKKQTQPNSEKGVETEGISK